METSKLPTPLGLLDARARDGGERLSGSGRAAGITGENGAFEQALARDLERRQRAEIERSTEGRATRERGSDRAHGASSEAGQRGAEGRRRGERPHRHERSRSLKRGSLERESGANRSEARAGPSSQAPAAAPSATSALEPPAEFPVGAPMGTENALALRAGAALAPSAAPAPGAGAAFQLALPAAAVAAGVEAQAAVGARSAAAGVGDGGATQPASSSARGPARAQAAPESRTPASPADLERARHILEQVRVRISAELRSATIQLRPQHLGRVSIRLQVDEGELTAYLSAERPETLSALESHLPELRTMLARAGLETGRFEFELFQSFDGGGADRGDGQRGGSASHGQDAEDASAARALARALAATGVDFYV